MKTFSELEKAFGLYLDEIKRCEDAGLYWALLHLVVVLPDICGALEGAPRVGERYVKWCAENFPCTSALTPGDLFQLRNAVLHEGTTLARQTQYASFSFVEPGATQHQVHGLVARDTTRGKDNLALDMKKMADDMRDALRAWFEMIEADPARNAVVEVHLDRAARVQVKASEVQIPDGVLRITYPATSST